MPTSRVPTITGQWECTECGHIFKGVETKRPARCPECDAPGDALDFFAEQDDVEEDDWEDEADELDILDDDDLDEDDYDDDGDEDDAFADDDY